MTTPPYIVVKADSDRPLTTIQVRVYPDRIVTTELGGPWAMNETPEEAASEVKNRCMQARDRARQEA